MSYENSNTLKNYFFNRIVRIYPGLYVNIFIILIILSLFGIIHFSTELLIWLVANMSVFQIYNNIDMFKEFGTGSVNGVLWTISVELTFYILLPLLYILNKKYSYSLFILFILSFILWSIDSQIGSWSSRTTLQKHLHVNVFTYLFYFILGMKFYIHRIYLSRYIENKFYIWFLAYCGYLYFGQDIFSVKVVFELFKWIIFSFCIFSFAYSFTFFSNFLKNNDYTYGIYIYHMLIINTAVTLKVETTIINSFFIVLLSILSGIISWHFLEKKFLKLKKKTINRIE